MKTVGIDLSMRSAGLCGRSGVLADFKQLKTDDEQLLVEVAAEIRAFLKKHCPDTVNLEGLSFGSISGSKDIIAGLFWYVRCMIYTDFPEIKVNIVPVLSWRSPLFDKAERKQIKEYTAELKKVKSKMKGIKGKAREEMALE
jgi:hypothetical protein